jgi:hypothetical protein
MVIADVAGYALAVNGRWVTASGLSPAESDGRGWQRAFQPESAARLGTRIAEAARSAGDVWDRFCLASEPGRQTLWRLAPYVQPPETLVAVAMTDAGRRTGLAPLLSQLPALFEDLDRMLTSLETALAAS